MPSEKRCTDNRIRERERLRPGLQRWREGHKPRTAGTSRNWERQQETILPQSPQKEGSPASGLRAVRELVGFEPLSVVIGRAATETQGMGLGQDWKLQPSALAGSCPMAFCQGFWPVRLSWCFRIHFPSLVCLKYYENTIHIKEFK